MHSRLRRVALVIALGGAGGCDLVFGVDADTAPCSDASFADATPSKVVDADTFSLSWARDRIVYGSAGSVFEMALPGGDPLPVETMPYTPNALALAPEGDAMFLTAEIEPPLLQAAVRTGGASWLLDAVVPPGAIAGTPSAAEFGPRRVVVRLHLNSPKVQEYEADGNRWRPVGDVHAIAGLHVPNLTPSGLDLVYDDAYGDAPGVFLAHRASTDAWFGAPVAILPGLHLHPQLLGRCHTLYTADVMPGTNPVVERYDH